MSACYIAEFLLDCTTRAKYRGNLLMRNLSKSKLIAYRQCPRRLWLEVHRPELNEVSELSQAAFKIGHNVGEIACRIYDPNSTGTLIDRENGPLKLAFQRTQELLGSSAPIFEAGFVANGAMAFADVLLPLEGGEWRMVEVKSSTSIKDYYRDDIAIQAYVAKSAGLSLSAVAIAHIDSSWVYPGDEMYEGILVETDLSEEAFTRQHEVEGWISQAHEIVATPVEPDIKPGQQCFNPYECGFINHCKKQEPVADYPTSVIPRIQSNALKSYIASSGVSDIRDIPDELLNERQLRVKTCTLTNERYFDAASARACLIDLEHPAYFLDFETISFAIPVWKGTRPYQQIPFQFSLHHLSDDGSLSHKHFLDLSGEDPSRKLAEGLISLCGEKGAIFAYNAGFETGRINDLARRFPDLSDALTAINNRVFDLLRVVANTYYHPAQQGSWSIKAVLPTIAPDLNYENLEGVQNGDLAMDAFREAMHPETLPSRREQIHKQLLDYCFLDTLAMVRLWEFLMGKQ